jgi:drug/metabolite transporter (DMT)-like permease
MRRLVWLAIIASGFGWGTLGIGNRALLNRGVPTFTITAYRGLIATAALVGWLILARRPLPRSARVWATAAVMAVGNMIVPFVALVVAVDNASAGYVSLIVSLITLSTALWSHAMLDDEPLSGLKVAGMLLAVAGVAVLVMSGDSGLVAGGRPLVATGFALLAVFTIGYARMYARLHASTYDPDAITAAQFLIGTAVLFPVAWTVDGFGSVPTGLDWAVLGYVGLACTVLPFFLMFWLSQRASATQTALSNYLVPVFGVIGGAIVLGEQLQTGLLVAGPLIVGGVVIVDALEHRRRTRGRTA